MINICNTALNSLGQESISSIDEQNDRARKCKQFYDSSRESLLRIHDWGFSQTDVLLVKLPTENYLNKRYVFLYPTDCLFLKKIYSATNPETEIKYSVGYLNGQKVIVTDELEPTCSYTKNVEDTSLFDRLFKDALSYLLASKMAMALTGDTTLLNISLKQYEVALANATITNKDEGTEEVDNECSFIGAR